MSRAILAQHCLNLQRVIACLGDNIAGIALAIVGAPAPGVDHCSGRQSFEYRCMSGPLVMVVVNEKRVAQRISFWQAQTGTAFRPRNLPSAWFDSILDLASVTLHMQVETGPLLLQAKGASRCFSAASSQRLTLCHGKAVLRARRILR